MTYIPSFHIQNLIISCKLHFISPDTLCVPGVRKFDDHSDTGGSIRDSYKRQLSTF
jgi:hypothetical protein